MKTLITTIAIGLTVLTAQANHSSAFNLKMFDNGNFYVILDNQSSPSQGGFFSVNSLAPGNHRLKVIRYYAQPHGFSMVQKVVYKGWITIPARSVVYASINCHNQFDIVKVEPYFYPPVGGGCGNGWTDDDCDDEYGYGYGSNCGNEGNGWNMPPAPPMPYCISQMEFIQLKNSIASRSFDDSKLQIAKQALAYNKFSSAQIADLMAEFSFETSKLDLAKSAYAKVVDKQNYYLVNNAFAFDSSIQELNQYIAMGK